MTLPDFSFERQVFKKGFRVIAGVDEVGRGCFAGPIVAVAVGFDSEGWRATGGTTERAPSLLAGGMAVGLLRDRTPIIINDSKKLTAKQREIASFWIKRNALVYGIGKASVAEINKFGIKKASEIAFRRAIKNCNKRIDYLLIDAFYIPYVKGLRRKNQKAIVHGDARSVSIAAASIIAKVYRDKLMTKLSQKPKYKKYKWGGNKGYGTLEHRKAIRKYGVTRLHRRKFVETWLLRSCASSPVQ